MNELVLEEDVSLKGRKPKRLSRGIFLGFVAITALGGLTWLLFFNGGDDVLDADSPLVPATRGDLIISVLEGGNLKALESHEIKCQVEGHATILELVEEGTQITEQDIENGRILVKLDASELSERLKTQEISYQSAYSDYVMSKEALEIQLKQNDSDIKAGELAVKFALMDLQRYLGEDLASRISSGDIDLFSPQILGKERSSPGLIKGASLQRWRELDNAIMLAEEQLELAKDDLHWTEELAKEKFVSQNDLKAAQLLMMRRDVEWSQTKTDLDLFLKYEFYKEAEKLLSDYKESYKELERIQARARAQETQKRSSLEANTAKYELQKSRLEDYRRQIENCTIRATAPGLVVWANQSGDWGRDSRRIEEGGTVRERQTIITIPDISTMAVEVKVHESSVKGVRVGQRAIVTVDAQPDLDLHRKVLKVGVLPDNQSRWLNPALKVYSTDVSIEEDLSFLKPGMSAQVRIVLQEKKDVLLVPIQTVVARSGQRFCFTMKGGETVPVVVVTGDYNDTFIEIKEGLGEGDMDLLSPPGTWALIDRKASGAESEDARPGKKPGETETPDGDGAPKWPGGAQQGSPGQSGPGADAGSGTDPGNSEKKLGMKSGNLRADAGSQAEPASGLNDTASGSGGGDEGAGGVR